MTAKWQAFRSYQWQVAGRVPPAAQPPTANESSVPDADRHECALAGNQYTVARFYVAPRMPFRFAPLVGRWSLHATS